MKALHNSVWNTVVISKRCTAMTTYGKVTVHGSNNNVSRGSISDILHTLIHVHTCDVCYDVCDCVRIRRRMTSV